MRRAEKRAGEEVGRRTKPERHSPSKENVNALLGPLVYVLVPPLKFGPDCVVHEPEYWTFESSFCTVVFVNVALR